MRVGERALMFLIPFCAIAALGAEASESLAFDGTVRCGSYVDSPAGAEQTFACWFKALGQGEGDKPYDRIIQTPDWFLHTFSEPDWIGGLQFGCTDTAGQPIGVGTAGNAVFGVWQHVAVTFSNKAGYRVYVNGQETARREFGVGVLKNMSRRLRGGTACLGNIAPGAKRPFKGEICQAKFWTRALSTEDVARLAANDPDGQPVRRIKSAQPTAADLVPVVDLTAETNRQTVIAQGTEKVYQGHPTTLLADDGKTLFCVWTINHGGKCGPMAKSTDGGRTWTRLDGQMPSEFHYHMNCPTFQKVPRPNGGVNYCVFSANCQPNTGGGLGILMSEDKGKTWKVMPPATHLSAGMPPTGFLPLKNGTCALFGQIRKPGVTAGDTATSDQSVWMSMTRDGGKTWSPARIIAEAKKKNLCEPFAVRSPDGREIAVIMRENRHDAYSMVTFSSDEGKTWSAPIDTCWGLTGDRHEGLLLPDGRLLVAFRDRAISSPTCGQYVAWVGTWEDLKTGGPGQYRIHLIRSYAGTEHGGWVGDTGYSGVERLSDGMIVCTTYCKINADRRQQSVVSTRFRIEETDKEFRGQKVQTKERKRSK